MVNPNIFRPYDIRGIYPDEINRETAYKIGRALVKFIKTKEQSRTDLKIVVGRDTRPSSPKLFESLTKGILEEDADVVDIGLCSSPLLYFSVNMEKADGGVMITASHIPLPYNGFKLTRERAFPISGETGIKEIQAIIERDEFGESNQKGKIFEKNFLEDYVDLITKDIKVKNLKIIADAGNGMAGLVLPKVFEKLEIDYVPLYFELDCSFPNHEANPLKDETLEDLKQKIIEEKGDLGIAFDGDGDRIRFITKKGEPVRGDLITALLAKDFLKFHPGSKILYNLISSRIVKETIKKNGGIPVRSRVGHSFIKQLMDEEGVFFGGEVSGHYYFQEVFNRESGVLAMIKVLDLMTRENKTLSELVKSFKKYIASPEINFTVKDINKKMEEIEGHYQDGKIDHLDGLTVEYKNWWFNARPSANDPVLRLNLEANTKELYNQKLEELEKIIKVS